MIAIDSNILIYYLDPTLKEHRHVIDYVEETIRREEILTSTVIWLEVSHYIYRVSPISKEKPENSLRKLIRLSSMYVMDFDVELFFDTVKILDELNSRNISIGGRDSSILAMMRRLNVNTIVTHDRDFKKLEDKGMIQVLDPILLRKK